MCDLMAASVRIGLRWSMDYGEDDVKKKGSLALSLATHRNMMYVLS